MNWYTRWGKRLCDLVVVIGLAPFAVPAIIVLSIIIFTADRHNPIFVQRRIGRELQPFALYKLRTLPASTADKPTHETDLSGASKLGERLRSWKLDELPQLLNVLRGEMSLVGPRPCLPSQKQLITERQARGVFAARPGITGRSQVAGLDMSDPVALAKSDADYTQQVSPGTDLYILVDTVFRRY